MLIQRISTRYSIGNLSKAIELLKSERDRLEHEHDTKTGGESRTRLMTPWQVADTGIAEYQFENVDDMRAKWERWESSDAGKTLMQAYKPLIEPGMSTELFDLFPGQPPRDPIKPGYIVQRLTVRYKVGASHDALKMLVAESQRCRDEGISFFGDARFYAPWSVSDTSVGDFVFANAGEIESAWRSWENDPGTQDFYKGYGPLMMSGFVAEINKVL